MTCGGWGCEAGTGQCHRHTLPLLHKDSLRGHRRARTAIFTVNDFNFEVTVTGKKPMDNISTYATIGIEPGYI